MSIAFRYAARSDVGLGPKGRNEDAGYAGPHLLVLADGMGGHAAGDVASSMIVGALAPLDTEGTSGEQALRVLGRELLSANTALRAAMDDDENLEGMGSTTIAMLRAGNKLAMAHIGDSRAYLLRDQVLNQITRDHSFVQHLLDEERITEDEALHHPQRSLVTRVMTGNPDDEPDLSIRELRVGDRYLLCSDGLTDFVSAEVVGEILSDSETPEEAAEQCVEVALRAHTRDNVTVVVADVVDTAAAADAAGVPDLPTAPEIVGAAAVRRATTVPTEKKTSPAEKAAALSREATGTPVEEPALAEEGHGPRVVWLRRVGLVAALLLMLIGGGFAGYQWTQNQVFIAAAGDHVAIYQGIDQQLGPVTLSTLLEDTDVLVTDLPDHYQESIRDAIQVGSLDEARERIETLRDAAERCRESIAAGKSCGANDPTGPASTGTATTTTTGPTPLPTSVITVTIAGPDGEPRFVSRTVIGGSVVTPTAGQP